MYKLSYKPGSSLIHRLYPLTKLVWLFLGSGILFLITDGTLMGLQTLLLFAVLTSVEKNILRVRGFRFVLLTGLFLFALYLLFEKGGAVLLNSEINLFSITQQGLQQGLVISGRFLSIVFLSYLFVLTTQPSALAYSLMKVGLPYRYGFMLVTALRLAPILEEEGRTIYQAQLVRGVQYDHKKPRSFLLLIRQFLTPLMIGVLRRVDKLVFSMEGRGFGRNKIRTYRRQAKPGRLDISAHSLMVLFFAVLLWINFGGF